MILSLLMITKNSAELLDNSLKSVQGLVDEIIIVDDFSSDNTCEIAKKFRAVIFKKSNKNLGKQRSFGLSICKGEWILMLDADEIISQELKNEIISVVSRQLSVVGKISGYYIPYQNHFLGRPIYYGGENYRILRLFKRASTHIPENVVHEHVRVSGKVGFLNNKIFHYSYRTLYQTYKKFTDYARREANRKLSQGERTSLRKLILYPIHMFWARYIKDCGFKDYGLRILLDIGFAYMEFLTYFFMLFNLKKYKKAN